MVVNVKIERARHEHGAVRPQHSGNLGEALPEARYVLERVHRQHAANRAVAVRQVLHIGDEIDSGPAPRIHAGIGTARKQASQIRHRLLPRDLKRADFQNRAWQFERLRHRPNHAVNETIHTSSSVMRFWTYSLPQTGKNVQGGMGSGYFPDGLSQRRCRVTSSTLARENASGKYSARSHSGKRSP